MPYHLAQINIARLVAPVDDPKIAGFVAQLDAINALAEAAPGFVSRLQSPAVNMSVWQSVESLRGYVYNSGHAAAFRDRAKWFEKMSLPSYCLWWVPEGHVPTVAEGRERLEHYQKHGATAWSFWFKQEFPAPEQVPTLQFT
jgi:hypothetical protein